MCISIKKPSKLYLRFTVIFMNNIFLKVILFDAKSNVLPKTFNTQMQLTMYSVM